MCYGLEETSPRCAAGDSASSPLASDGNKAETVALAARIVRNVRSVRGMTVAIFARNPRSSKAAGSGAVSLWVTLYAANTHCRSSRLAEQMRQLGERQFRFAYDE